ncbi:BglG family transcription antiterminator [Alkalihalobacillus macyae]|uniref:BglG family transcription antiterminator n=1 Tax=Guptibacillus hwajinpoensis TaxID=208199 RepID=UPI00273B4206|nr:BglG family transcription antiterminator [Alkalihalobacillus macyae]MDP4549603.1 BglG family transcription antiterminator [Alkalihalobacillus macyae]
MNRRQQKLLLMLLESKKTQLVSKLASRLSCSEKTVRNDLGTIKEYVESETSGELIKKPGLGVYIEVEEYERNRLFQTYSFIDTKKEEVIERQRKVEIAYELLITKDPISIQTLSERYYVNRPIIRKDLEDIRIWLKAYELDVHLKQKIGLRIEGDEMARRKAISNLSEVVNDGPLVHSFLKKQFSSYEISLVENELRTLQDKHGISYTDEAYENLLLHTLFTVKRVKQRQNITLRAEDFDRVTSTAEYTWAKEMLKKLEIVFVAHFPQEEIAYLALHFIGGKRRDLREVELEIDPIAKELVERMTELTSLSFHEDDALMEGLRVHLYAALNRITYGLSVTNPMLQEIKHMYPYLFDLLIGIASEFSEKHAINIPEDEVAYLTLHFEAAVERLHSNRGKRKRAVIVCHLGVGMSQLLRSKLERKFASLTILDCISRGDLSSFLKKEELDLVISTVTLDTLKSIPSIVISPLLNIEEESKLEAFIESIDRTMRGSIITTYVKPEFVYVYQEPVHRFKVIEELANALYHSGYVKREYAARALERERTSSTNIGSGISIPHGDPTLIQESAIAVAVMKEPIEWERENVSLVFLLAVKNDKSEETRALFREISTLSENPLVLREVVSQTNPQAVIDSLRGTNPSK